MSGQRRMSLQRGDPYEMAGGHFGLYGQSMREPIILWTGSVLEEHEFAQVGRMW